MTGREMINLLVKVLFLGFVFFMAPRVLGLFIPSMEHLLMFYGGMAYMSFAPKFKKAEPVGEEKERGI